VPTRLQVETDIQYALDEPGTNWLGTTGLHNMVGAAYLAAWDIILSKWQDYQVTVSTFTIASGNTFTLLVDSAPGSGQILRTSFYKLRMLQRKSLVDSIYRQIMPMTLEESGSFDSGLLGFMFIGDVIYVEPTTSAPGDYQVWYIPQTTPLANDADVLVDPVNGGVRQYVIDVCCKRLRAKDDLPESAFKGFADELAQRLDVMGGNRTGRSRIIPDVRENMPPRFRTRRGRWI